MNSNIQNVEASIQERKPLFFLKALAECPYSGLHQGVSRTSEGSFMVLHPQHAAVLWLCVRVNWCSLAQISSSVVIDLQGYGLTGQF